MKFRYRPRRGYYTVDGYPLRDGLRAAIGELGKKFRRRSRQFAEGGKEMEAVRAVIVLVGSFIALCLVCRMEEIQREKQARERRERRRKLMREWWGPGYPHTRTVQRGVRPPRPEQWE